MSARTKTRARPRDEVDRVPQRLELLCNAERITLAALAVEGDAPAIPRFSMVAYTGEPMRIEGWRFPVVVDLAGMTIPAQRRPVRFGHSMYAGVGHTERVVVEAGRLLAEGVISRDTDIAREVVASGKRGFPWQASIGAQVGQAEFIRAGKSVTVNGRTLDGPLYVARRTTLGEISFVDLGADTNTTATIAAHQHEEDALMDEPEDTPGPTTDDSPTSSPSPAPAREPAPAAPADEHGRPMTQQASYDADGGAIAEPRSVRCVKGRDADPSAAALSALRAQALAETKRLTAVRRICAGKFPQIEEKAIAEGWSTEKCELEVLRASRPKAPAIHAVDNALSGNVIEAACMLTARLATVEELYDHQTLEAASKRFRGGIGLQELLLEAAWANGYDGRNFRDSRSVLRFAFGHNLQAAFSTIDIGGILSNVANKFLLEGFFSVERVWRNITAIRNVSDFKAVTSYRLVGRDQYEKVAPGGELKHGTLGEETYSNKAETFGLLLSVDRRDIINDDLGAITTVPRKLGRGSGLKINDVFWTTFLANSDFFKAANNNYISGADTQLGIDGLTRAETAFMDQVDAEGKPIGVMPQIVLVPTALSAMATMLYKSLEFRDTTANTKMPTANPHANKFRVEVSRYLSNLKYPGNSAKAWYLLAGPDDLPVIETAFLNGQEAPTIETAEADFNVLGVQMRGYHDFGCALQDPKGGLRSKGEA